MKQPLHVFIVASPIIGLVAYEFISERKIDPQDVLIVFIRGQKLVIFNEYKSMQAKKSPLNKLSSKLSLFFPTYGDSIQARINSFGRQFFMYSSWLDAVASVVLRSDLCIGHSYLEEGDQAYKNFPVFPSVDFYSREPKTESNKYIYKDYWRDDAKEWIGITDKSFSAAPPGRRVILHGFKNVKNIYKPMLKPQDCVLLLPTPGRLPREQWRAALLKLNIYPEKKTYLKLHPAFFEIKNVISVFSEMLMSLQFRNIQICDQSIILEAEMLFNHLILVGDRSSLERYADYFGSTFIKVPFLYGEAYGELY